MLISSLVYLCWQPLCFCYHHVVAFLYSQSKFTSCSELNESSKMFSNLHFGALNIVEKPAIFPSPI